MKAVVVWGMFERPFEGSGETRSARPTDIAFKILLDKQIEAAN
jgi:hypothetical protein